MRLVTIALLLAALTACSIEASLRGENKEKEPSQQQNSDTAGALKADTAVSSDNKS